MAVKSLQGLNVLVTRSRAQAQPLIESLQLQGANVHFVPLLEIKDYCPPHQNQATIEHLDAYDDIIFISANAVVYGLKHLSEHGKQLPSQARLFCVGEKTKKTLAELDYPHGIVPNEEFSSDGLLALPELKDIGRRRILIVRGKGGREMLKHTLQQRGAEVDYFECYERVFLHENTARLNQVIKAHAIEAVCCSSLQTFEHLVSMLETDVLKNSYVVSISRRMTQYAVKNGFKKPIIQAKSAADSAILEALQQLANRNNDE